MALDSHIAVAPSSRRRIGGKAETSDSDSEKWQVMRFKFIAIATLALAGQPALAQIQRYDPNTGKYFTSDPFASAAPAVPNPNRLDPSASRATTSQGRQRLGSSQANSGNGGSLNIPGMTTGQQSASGQQFVPLGDMAMYEDGAVPSDPFAKPDWWPQ